MYSSNTNVRVIIEIFATHKWKNKRWYVPIVTVGGQVVRICKERFEINQVRYKPCWCNLVKVAAGRP